MFYEFVGDVWRLLRRRVFVIVSSLSATFPVELYSLYYCCATTIIRRSSMFGRFSCRAWMLSNCSWLMIICRPIQFYTYFDNIWYDCRPTVENCKYRIVHDWLSSVDDWLYWHFNESYYQFRSVFTLIIHRYIISLISSSRLCLPPCQCLQSLPVSRFRSASRFPCRRPRPTSDTAASASSPTPVLPASYFVTFVRDSEQITAIQHLRLCLSSRKGR